MQTAESVHQEPESCDVDITPLLDVVFILLIFFIVTASFVRESGLGLNPPVHTPPALAPSTAVVIGIGATNSVTLDGIPTDIRALGSRLQRISARNPLTNVVINPHPHSSTDLLIKVMDSSRLAGLLSLSLARNDL